MTGTVTVRSGTYQLSARKLAALFGDGGLQDLQLPVVSFLDCLHLHGTKENMTVVKKTTNQETSAVKLTHRDHPRLTILHVVQNCQGIGSIHGVGILA